MYLKASLSDITYVSSIFCRVRLIKQPPLEYDCDSATGNLKDVRLRLGTCGKATLDSLEARASPVV